MTVEMKQHLGRFWRITGLFGKFPDFLIIGAQKAGTTSLYAYLVQHPQVVPAVRKEIHFFDYRFDKGLSFYRAYFPWRRNRRDGKKKMVTGEASPGYLVHPRAPERIAKTVPSAKLIVLLRDPVQRAYSHYNHKVRKKIETLAFDEAVAREAQRLEGEIEKILADDTYASHNFRHFSYLRRGIYVDQLKAYEKYFDRSQMLVLKSEDLYGKTQEVFRQVLDFLEIDNSFQPNLEAQNIAEYSKLDAGIRKELQAYFEPHNRRLYEYLGRDLGW